MDERIEEPSESPVNERHIRGSNKRHWGEQAHHSTECVQGHADLVVRMRGRGAFAVNVHA